MIALPMRVSRTVRSYPFLLTLIALLSAEPAWTQRAMVDWTGNWDTTWQDGGVRLDLEQSGSTVTGRYPVLAGLIEGVVRDRLLVGTWSDASGEGTFVFAMGPDGQSFMGRFGSGEWWTGERVLASASARLVASTRSPAAALRTLVVAGNLARNNRYDDLGAALRVLDFSELPADAADNPLERLSLSRMLFRILDQLTFRIWNLPDPEPDAQEVTATLSQAGTRESVALIFRRIDGTDTGGGWRIVVPPADVMQADLERLGAELPAMRDVTLQFENLTSPRDVMRSFLEGYFRWQQTGEPDLMLSTMNLSALPITSRDEEALRRAEYLKGVIDRIGYVIWQEIPDFPDRTEPYTYFTHPLGSIEIAPAEGENGARIWQFTPTSIHDVRDLYVALEDMPLAPGLEDVRLSQFLQLREFIRGIDRTLLRTAIGVEIWQWISLVIVVLTAAFVGWVISFVLLRVILGWKREPDSVLSIRNRFIRPLTLVIMGGALIFALKVLGLPGHADLPLRIVGGIVISVAGGWMAYHLVDKIGDLTSNPSGRFRTNDAMLRSVAVALAKVAVIVGSLLVLAEVLNIPYEGVIAGLGIGGLAVALAARSTLENFIAGLTLIADKPVRAGDFCAFGDKLGTVESLGLRSIRIRSLERTIVSIPNAEFLNMSIENYTRRDSILLKTVLHLRYETTADQLRWVLAEIRRLLVGHPRVRNDPSRARFVGYGEYSLDVEIFAYVDTQDYNEYLAICEDIYLRLADVVDALGTAFAFPSTLTYLARDGGMDTEKTEKVEHAVDAWRRNDRLPFPEFPSDERWEMLGTLPYPPAGSPDSRCAKVKRQAEGAG